MDTSDALNFCSEIERFFADIMVMMERAEEFEERFEDAVEAAGLHPNDTLPNDDRDAAAPPMPKVRDIDSFISSVLGSVKLKKAERDGFVPLLQSCRGRYRGDLNTRRESGKKPPRPNRSGGPGRPN